MLSRLEAVVGTSYRLQPRAGLQPPPLPGLDDVSWLGAFEKSLFLFARSHMTTPDFFEVVGLLTRLESRASSVWVSHLATKEKLEQMANTPWYDPDLDRYENKTRMKEFGAAGMNFKSFIAESQFVGLSNSVESFWVDLRVTFGTKYDIWKTTHSPLFQHEAKIVRCVGNIIKHNQSIIERKSSDHAKFLIDDAGFPDSIELKTLFISEAPLLCLKNMNYFMYMNCLDLLRLVTGFAHPIMAISEPERRTRIAQHLVPPVLALNAI